MKHYSPWDNRGGKCPSSFNNVWPSLMRSRPLAAGVFSTRNYIVSFFYVPYYLLGGVHLFFFLGKRNSHRLYLSIHVLVIPWSPSVLQAYASGSRSSSRYRTTTAHPSTDTNGPSDTYAGYKMSSWEGGIRYISYTMSGTIKQRFVPLPTNIVLACSADIFRHPTWLFASRIDPQKLHVALGTRISGRGNFTPLMKEIAISETYTNLHFRGIFYKNVASRAHVITRSSSLALHGKR